MRVLIVDDHQGVRKAIRRLLTAADLDVCGEATDGAEALDAVRQLAPDVIVMDLFMPNTSGIDAAREILQAFPTMPIILMTAPEAGIVEAARRIGIRGTVSKGSLDLVSGIHALLRGEEFHQLSNGDPTP